MSFATPRGVRLDTWRMEDETDPLYADFKDGMISASEFGKASDEMPEHHLFACLALQAKFYSLLCSEKQGKGEAAPPCALQLDTFFPQTVGQLRDSLAAMEGEVAAAMLRAVDEGGVTQEDMEAIKCFDEPALAAWWLRKLDLPRTGGTLPPKKRSLACWLAMELPSVIHALERQVPAPYTRLKAVRVQGNEMQLNYVALRRFLFEHVENAEEDSRAELTLARPQLLKEALDLRFQGGTSRVSAAYDKRLVVPRNLEWEQEHGAIRLTTVPDGYTGAVW